MLYKNIFCLVIIIIKMKIKTYFFLIPAIIFWYKETIMMLIMRDTNYSDEINYIFTSLISSEAQERR